MRQYELLLIIFSQTVTFFYKPAKTEILKSPRKKSHAVYVYKRNTIIYVCVRSCVCVLHW